MYSVWVSVIFDAPCQSESRDYRNTGQWPAYLQALFAHPVIPTRCTAEPTMHTPRMDRIE